MVEIPSIRRFTWINKSINLSNIYVFIILNIIFTSQGFVIWISSLKVWVSYPRSTLQIFFYLFVSWQSKIYIYFFIKATLREDYCFLRPQEPNQESLLFYGWPVLLNPFPSPDAIWGEGMCTWQRTLKKLRTWDKHDTVWDFFSKCFKVYISFDVDL